MVSRTFRVIPIMETTLAAFTEGKVRTALTDQGKLIYKARMTLKLPYCW